MSYTIRFNDGDIEVEPGGSQVMITNAEKAAQDLLGEILLPYDPISDRGNQMFNADGSFSEIAASPFGEAFVSSSLRSTVSRLQRLQAADTSASSSELIQTVTTVAVRSPDNDPTTYQFLVGVRVDDKNIGLAREISMRHTGYSPEE